MSSWNYLSKVGWFSEKSTSKSYKSVKHAMQMHYRYITNERREDLVAVKGLSWDEWKKLADYETSKRWDSRIAGKLVVALPNSITPEEAFRMIERFLQEGWGVKQYTIALHKNEGRISNKENFHAHVLFYARKPNGKKVRTSRKDLLKIREFWKQILREEGYEIKEHEIKHVRVSQYDVIHNTQAVKEIRKAVEEMRKFIEEARKKTQEIKENIKIEPINKELAKLFNKTGHNVMKFVKTAINEGYKWQDIETFFKNTGRERHIEKVKARLFQDKQNKEARSRIEEIADKLLRFKQEQEQKQKRKSKIIKIR